MLTTVETMRNPDKGFKVPFIWIFYHGEPPHYIKIKIIGFENSSKLVPVFGGIFVCNRLNLDRCRDTKCSIMCQLGEQLDKMFELIILGLFGYEENLIKYQ